MSWSFAFFTYLNAWWISLFLAWPFCIEARSEQASTEGYDYASAPKAINWKKMMLLTSLLAGVFTALIALIIHFARL